MIFYNPMIRFAFLSALKFNMTCLVVFKKESSSASEIFIAVVLFIGIAIVVPATLIRIINKNKEILDLEKIVKTYGTTYMGRRVINSLDERKVWIYPAIFFMRRTLFIIATVFLFEKPNM